MPPKQYRSRNKQLHQESHDSGFISYSSHLRKKQQQEMRVLQKIDYNSQLPNNKHDNQIFLFMKHKNKDDNKPYQKNKLTTTPNLPNLTPTKHIPHSHTPLNKSLSKPNQNYQKIDTSAVVIKGRLIYLKQQTDSAPSNDHFLHQLRHNNISAKEYLTGNQPQIQQRIKANESAKENQLIKEYILRNISEQSNGEVLVMDRFHEIKGVLFD